MGEGGWRTLECLAASNAPRLHRLECAAHCCPNHGTSQISPQVHHGSDVQLPQHLGRIHLTAAEQHAWPQDAGRSCACGCWVMGDAAA